jgi:parallel beta-helix repeat protein
MGNVSADPKGGSGASLRLQLSLAVVTTLVAILAATGLAKAVTPITACGDVITAGGTPGFQEVYTLTTNLSCSGSDGIDIQASYVTINLNGHSITGDGSSLGIFAYSSAGRLKGIVIMGPIPGQSPVQSFNIGIEMDNVDNSTVQNIVLARNNYGLATDLLDQVNNTVTGLKLSTNTATLNANDGFALYNSSGASVSANIAVGNGSSGSALTLSTDLPITVLIGTRLQGTMARASASLPYLPRTRFLTMLPRVTRTSTCRTTTFPAAPTLGPTTGSSSATHRRVSTSGVA